MNAGQRKLSREERRRLLEISIRRARPGTGSVLLELREASNDYSSTKIIPDFGDIPHAIVGGLATAQYMPRRMTEDSDVLVLPKDLAVAEKVCVESCCSKLGALAIGGSSWRMANDRMLDLIALDFPWVEDALATSVAGDDGLPYVRLPFLVVMKLGSGRLQDLADISRMLGCASEHGLAEVREIVKRYNPGDVEDLESMIILGRLEHSSEDSTES